PAARGSLSRRRRLHVRVGLELAGGRGHGGRLLLRLDRQNRPVDAHALRLRLVRRLRRGVRRVLRPDEGRGAEGGGGAGGGVGVRETTSAARYTQALRILRCARGVPADCREAVRRTLPLSPTLRSRTNSTTEAQRGEH